MLCCVRLWQEWDMDVDDDEEDDSDDDDDDDAMENGAL
jgi:hypothetical protein